MDVLMTEATDLILSNNNIFGKDLNNAFKWVRRKSSDDVTDGSSITLLRTSIAKSLKERSQSEVVHSFEPKRRKCRRRAGSFSGRSKVDVKFLDSEIEAADNHEKKQRGLLEEQNKSNVPENVLSNLFTEECNSEEIVQVQSLINQTVTNEDVINNTIPNDKDTSSQHNPVEIGLRLAQRQFSDSIFENCSTYSLTSPEVLPNTKNSSSQKTHLANSSKFLNNKSSKSDADMLYPDLTTCADDKKSENVDNDNYSDDHMSLTDSFFANVNNSDDNTCQNSVFSKDADSSLVNKRSSIFSLSKESIFSVPDESKFDSEASQLKSERKLSKKERKRQKKNKSNKDAPTYDCPKCGVSYVLSNNASRTTARCLHCDFWKSVEPVFLKTEKQPWNTCRIC